LEYVSTAKSRRARVGTNGAPIFDRCAETHRSGGEFLPFGFDDNMVRIPAKADN
jgi:hypothetical protein